MIEAMDEPEEMLDLVNERDEPIGAIARHEVLSLEENGRGFTRAVGIFIVNSKGELWVPRRGEHKKIAPGGLDFSAGEHVGHGEPYETAALRGLQEELHMNPDPSKLFLIGRVPPFSGIPYFHEIFEYRSDETPSFNSDDFTGYEWLTPQAADSRLSAGEPAKEILQPSIQLILQHLADKGDLR